MKMRAFYKPLKRMLAPDQIESINFDTKVLGVYMEMDGKGYHKLRMSDFEIMWYTGLSDSKGVEIFEKDILKRNFEIGNTVYDPVSLGAMDYEIVDSGYFIGVVSHRPTEGWVLNKCKKFNEDDEFVSTKSGVKIYARYAEVIGNRWDNLELLEGQDE